MRKQLRRVDVSGEDKIHRRDTERAEAAQSRAARLQVVKHLTSASFTGVVCVLVLCGACLIDAAAQTQQRRRPSRRVTNPVRRARTVAPPVAVDAEQPQSPQIISTAEQDAAAEADRQAIEGTYAPGTRRSTRNARTTNRNATAVEAENQDLRRKVDQLSEQMTKISSEVGSMREDQRTMVNLERLSRAEERGEGYRAQLRQVTEKEADLQARLEQIEIEILPENIERRAAGAGSLRPELVRDQIRKQLENERTRTQTQLDALAQNHSRLASVIANTDAEVDRLRARVEDADRETPANPINASGLPTSDSVPTVVPPQSTPNDTAPPPA